MISAVRNSGSPNDGSPSQSLNPLARADVLRVMAFARRYWRRCVAGLALGMLAGFTYWCLASSKYTAEAEILIARKDPRLPAQGPSVTTSEKPELSEDLLSTHVQLICSDRVINRALDQLGPEVRQVIHDLKKHKQTESEYIAGEMTADKGGEGQMKDAHVVVVSFRHPDAEEGARILKTIIACYKDFLKETFENVNTEALQLLSTNTKDLDAELKQQELAYQKFRREAPLLWKGEESSNVHYNRLLEMEDALSKLKVHRAEVQGRLRVLEETLAAKEAVTLSDLERLALIDTDNTERLGMIKQTGEGSSTTGSFQASQPAREELVTLRSKRAGLLATLGPQHPQIEELDQSIKAIEGYLGPRDPEFQKTATPTELVNAFTGLLQHDLKDFDYRISELVGLIEPERKSASELVKYELQDESIRAELTRKKELYLTLIERLRDLDLMRSGDYIAEVIAEPHPGLKPSPSLGIALAFGGVLGMLLGGAAGLGSYFFGPETYDDPRQIEKSVGVSVLAHVPNFQPRPEPRHGRFGFLLGEKPAVSPDTIASQSVEAFRRLRGALLARGEDNHGRIVQFSSPLPGQGTSTIVAELAKSVAAAGKRVLIVDCQLRRPRMHELFHVEGSAGLVDVLEQEREPLDVVCQTAFENLWVLPAGSSCKDPVELLATPALGELVATLRQRYDLVLIDSPAVLTVADARVLAPAVDGTVLVIEVLPQCSGDLQRAKQLLAETGAALQGLVVNCHEIEDHYRFHDYDLLTAYNGHTAAPPVVRHWSFTGV